MPGVVGGWDWLNRRGCFVCGCAQVYSIPMLLVIGWRGEPGRKDEPQHLVQGPVTPNLLASMNIPFEILPDYKEGAEEVLDDAMRTLRTRSSPYALLVKKRTFAPYKLKAPVTSDHELTREDFLRVAVDELGEWDVVVATTGFTSRELYELRDEFGHGHERDFLTVGSMGHASAIAGGIAIAKPSRNVFTLDGDGAVIMHMGTLSTMGALNLPNFKHVVINNGAHDSVGGQPTGGHSVLFTDIAKACGYSLTITADTEEEIRAGLQALRYVALGACSLLRRSHALPRSDGVHVVAVYVCVRVCFLDVCSAHNGPAMLEVRVRPGVRKDLGRPKTTPLQNKDDFQRFLDY